MMVHGAEALLVHVLAICTSLEKCLLQTLCWFLNCVICALTELYVFVFFWYIPDPSPLLDVLFAGIFSDKKILPCFPTHSLL